LLFQFNGEVMAWGVAKKRQLKRALRRLQRKPSVAKQHPTACHTPMRQSQF
jgi:hypothetical protein